MMRRYFAISLLLLLILPSAPAFVAAQAADCNPMPLYEQAATLKSSGDAKKDIAALVEFADGVRQANIACNGMTFSGKTNKAIGVVEIPAGTWLATLTTKGYFILNSKIIDGSCDVGSSLFAVSKGEAADSISAVIESKGCRVLFTSELVSTEYVLTFEPVS